MPPGLVPADSAKQDTTGVNVAMMVAFPEIVNVVGLDAVFEKLPPIPDHPANE